VAGPQSFVANRFKLGRLTPVRSLVGRSLATLQLTNGQTVANMLLCHESTKHENGSQFVMSTENSRYLKRRRHRKVKVQKLIDRLKKPHDARERAKLVDKLWKVNPFVIPPELTK
jgi:hypothetical protein